jgi:long-subunit acyl-CoA synthetase (AMP-forming)
MSILGKILERLATGDTTLETFNRQGEVVHRLSARELVESVRIHRPQFALQGRSDRRVALLFKAEETVEFLIAAFAAIAEGLTVVPLYPNWTDEQEQLYLARYRLRTIAVGEGFRSRVEGWRSLLDRVIPVTARPPVPEVAATRQEAFPPNLPEDHPCALIFTSGTSGDLSKCTLITQANLAAAIENIADLGFLREGMVLHCPLSASHIFAFVVILGFLSLAPRRVIFSDVQYLARIPQEKLGKIDAMILVPLVLNRMRAAFYERLARPELLALKEKEKAREAGENEAAKPDPSLVRLARLPAVVRKLLRALVLSAERAVIARESGSLFGVAGWPLVLLASSLLGPIVRRRLSSPDFVVVGGAKPDLRSMAFLEAMGIRCLQGWGMTETTGPLAVCNLGDRFRGAFGTCGDLFRRARASIEGEELVVEGPQIAAGYVEPDGSLTPFGGRLRTGDFARFDRRGRLKVLGKVSDRITLQNGINYNPIHFEELIQAFDVRLDNVLELAVVIGDGQSRLGCVFFLREPHEPVETTRSYLGFLLREVNSTLHVDEQIGPWVVSPKRLREADVLSPSAKIIRRRIEERWEILFEQKPRARLAGVKG